MKLEKDNDYNMIIIFIKSLTKMLYLKLILTKINLKILLYIIIYMIEKYYKLSNFMVNIRIFFLSQNFDIDFIILEILNRKFLLYVII